MVLNTLRMSLRVGMAPMRRSVRSLISNGAQLGDSRTNIDTWNNGTTDVTNTNTNYHGPDGEWLGNEYSNDQGEAGSMFNSTVAKLI